MTSLKAHKSLEGLWLEGTDNDNSFEWLGVSNTGIGVEDCQALGELLSSSTSLKKLHIGGNDLPPEAVELIISRLHHNTSLEWLDMFDSHFSHQSTISLALELQTNRTLVYLNLAGCDMDSDGACQLASELCTNYTLQTLFLGENQGEEDIQKLIDSLTHNTTVKELHLPRKYKSSIDSSRVLFTHGVALSN